MCTHKELTKRIQKETLRKSLTLIQHKNTNNTNIKDLNGHFSKKFHMVRNYTKRFVISNHWGHVNQSHSDGDIFSCLTGWLQIKINKLQASGRMKKSEPLWTYGLLLGRLSDAACLLQYFGGFFEKKKT